jgi:hypothetical protein
MKNQTFLITLVIILMAGVVVYAESYSTGNMSASISGQGLLEIRTPQNLRCDIKIKTHSLSSVDARYRIWAHAKTTGQEDRFIKLIEVKLDKNYSGENTIRIRVLSPTTAPWEGMSYGVGIEMDIYVPEDFAIDTRSMYGKVDVSGPLSRAKIDCEYGSVNVEDIDEDTDISSSYSNVSVSYLKGMVSIDAKYSEIIVEDIEIGDGPGLFKSTNGNIVLENITGPLEVTTNQSSIQASNIRTDSGCLLFRTDYGNIDAEDLSGELVVETSYGNIEMKDINLPYGISKFETKYSPIDVMIIDIEDAQLLVNNTYSSINLSLPSDISAKLTLSVDEGGKIHTQGLSIKPLIMESNRLVGIAGDGVAKIEANIDGIGDINIKGRQ